MYGCLHVCACACMGACVSFHGDRVYICDEKPFMCAMKSCSCWHSPAHYYIVSRISGGNIKSHEAVKGGIKASINCLDYFLVHDITTFLDTQWIIF